MPPKRASRRLQLEADQKRLSAATTVFEAGIKREEQALAPLRQTADRRGEELTKAESKTAEAKKAADTASEAVAKTEAALADKRAAAKATRRSRGQNARSGGPPSGRQRACRSGGKAPGASHGNPRRDQTARCDGRPANGNGEIDGPSTGSRPKGVMPGRGPIRGGQRPGGSSRAQAPGRYRPPPRPSHTAQLAEAGDLRSKIGRRLCSTFGGRCGRHGCRPAGQSSERRRAADCRDPRAACAGPRRRIGARRTLVFERRTGGSRRQARAEDRRRRVGRRPAGHLRGRRRPAHGGDSGKGRACRVRCRAGGRIAALVEPQRRRPAAAPFPRTTRLERDAIAGHCCRESDGG